MSGIGTYLAGNTSHTAIPMGGSYVREEDGEPASLLSDADYPVVGECKICHGRIRLRIMLQMDWQHAPAKVKT